MVTGTHILINARTNNALKLTDAGAFKEFIISLIKAHRLQEVGSVFHTFDGGGFTCVVCLTESHLAVHTWPEKNYYTADVYLCDYSRQNELLTGLLSNEIKLYFNSIEVKEQLISR